jgi:hypothetical protein
MIRARIDVENRYHAYLKGWRTAARVGAQDPAVAGPLDWDSARALRGWEDP